MIRGLLWAVVGRKPAITVRQAMDLAERHLETVLNRTSGQARPWSIEALDSRVDLFVEWRKSFSEQLAIRLTGRGYEDQRLALRRVCVDWIDRLADSREFISLSQDERKRDALCAKLYPAKSPSECIETAIVTAIYAEATVSGAHGILGLYFQDNGYKGWLDYYQFLANQAARSRLEHVLAETFESQPDRAKRLLSEGYADVATRARETVLRGAQIAFDENEIEQECLREEQERKAREPRRRNEIYPGEVEKITTLLFQRWTISKKDCLYRSGDKLEFSPQSSDRTMQVDLCVVVIVFRKNLMNPPHAEHYVKQVAYRLLQLIAQDDPRTRTSSADDMNIDIPVSIANIESAEGDPWLPSVLLNCFHYLYQTEQEDIESRDQRKLAYYAQQALQIGNDLWPLYADVMNVFGWEISPNWLPDSGDKAPPT